MMLVAGLALGGCAENGRRLAEGMAQQDTLSVGFSHTGDSCEDTADKAKTTCFGGCELLHDKGCVPGCRAKYAEAIRVCNGEVVVDAGAWTQPVASPSQAAAAAAAAENEAKSQRQPGGWPAGAQ